MYAIHYTIDCFSSHPAEGTPTYIRFSTDPDILIISHFSTTGLFAGYISNRVSICYVYSVIVIVSTVISRGSSIS